MISSVNMTDLTSQTFSIKNTLLGHVLCQHLGWRALTIMWYKDFYNLQYLWIQFLKCKICPVEKITRRPNLGYIQQFLPLHQLHKLSLSIKEWWDDWHSCRFDYYHLQWSVARTSTSPWTKLRRSRTVLRLGRTKKVPFQSTHNRTQYSERQLQCNVLACMSDDPSCQYSKYHSRWNAWLPLATGLL